MTGKRLFALLLVLCLLLSGCSFGKEEEKVSVSHADRQIQFKELSQKVEYAMLAATLQMPDFAGYGGPDDPAYLGNIDDDSDLEFVYGYELLTCDITENHFAYTPLSEYGYVYYLDKDGGFWAYGVLGDVDNSSTEWFESYSAWYQQWDGSGWVTMMACDVHNIYDYKDFVPAETPHTTEFSGEIGGTPVDKATWDGHLADLALTEVSTTSRDFTSFTTEKLYRNAIEKDLYEYLVTYYDCSETVTFDADSDGQNESYFAVRNPFRLWAEALEQDSNYNDLKDWLGYDYESEHTVYIVADPAEDDTVTFTAYCVNGYLDISRSGIYYNNGCLGINGDNLGLSGDYRTIRDLDSQQKETAYSYLLDTLENQGYSCYGFKWTDLSDSGNGEMLCICNDGSGYVALLFTLKDGRFSQIWQMDLNSSACYLVTKDGKQYLLEYTQRVDNSSGVFYTYYSYDLFRFAADYSYQAADTQSVSYNSSQQDASAVSAFFDKFHGLFTDAVVLGDPFSVTGNQWGTTSDMDYGSLPQNPTAEGRLGYVQIEDPASFLFLREGPGKEYDPVLIDSGDPNSFVRQAQGSPVIILDEVHTGDAENPVWVRIRIHYGDREVVGYSSKRYIREAN